MSMQKIFWYSQLCICIVQYFIKNKGVTHRRKLIKASWRQILPKMIWPLKIPRSSCAQYLIILSKDPSLYSIGYHHLTFSILCVELSIDCRCSRILRMNGTIQSSHSSVEREMMLQYGVHLQALKLTWRFGCLSLLFTFWIEYWLSMFKNFTNEWYNWEFTFFCWEGNHASTWSAFVSTKA